MQLLGDVTTARLIGRRPTLFDLDAYVGVWTDPRVDEDAWPAQLRTEDDAERTLRASIAHWERWGFGPWTVVERESETVLGRVGLAHTDLAGRPEVELAWFLDADVWGRGYATEMAREAVRAAFEVLELDDVVSLATPANAASQAVMLKVGLRYEADVEHAGLPHVRFRLRRPDRPPG